MKLLIVSTTVVKGGKIKERGEIYDTGEDNRAADKEAYDLISAGRALDTAPAKVQDRQELDNANKQIATDGTQAKSLTATAVLGARK